TAGLMQILPERAERFLARDALEAHRAGTRILSEPGGRAPASVGSNGGRRRGMMLANVRRRPLRVRGPMEGNEGRPAAHEPTPNARARVAGGPPPLSNDELLRYARHLILPEVGLEGQQRLKASSVLIVGAGGLGSPLALYLAAAGVGRIGLVDFDRVEATNLQRQILYGDSSVGRSKLDVARERLEDLNPRIEIETHEGR